MAHNKKVKSEIDVSKFEDENLKEELKVQGDPKEFYKKKVMEISDSKKFNPDEFEEVAFLAWKYNKLVHNVYNDELEQILQFIMFSVQQSYTKNQAKN